MNAILTLLVRLAGALAALFLLALTAAMAAGVVAALLLRSTWLRLRGRRVAPVVQARRASRPASRPGLGAHEAVVDVVARGRG